MRRVRSSPAGRSSGRRLPAGLRDRGQAGGARVRGRQLRAARVGARVRAGRRAARGDDDRPEASSSAPITTTFVFVNEPSVIRYTTDGSKPNDELDAVGLDRAARAGRGVPPDARRRRSSGSRPTSRATRRPDRRSSRSSRSPTKRAEQRAARLTAGRSSSGAAFVTFRRDRRLSFAIRAAGALGSPRPWGDGGTGPSRAPLRARTAGRAAGRHGDRSKRAATPARG